MTEPPPLSGAQKAALRERVQAERRRAQRGRWSLAVSGTGAITAASLLGLVANAWLREEHRPAPRAQVVTKREVVVTTRYVRPKPRVKVVKVVRHLPAAATATFATASYAPARSYTAAPAAPAPTQQVQVQVSPPAPAPPAVSTHAS